MNADPAALAAALAAALGRPVAPAPLGPVGGSSIDAAYRWPAGAETLFVKLAPAAAAPRHAAEADGLATLRSAAALAVPAVLGRGVAGDTAWLALEWLELRPPDAAAEAALGEGLAALHRCHAARHGYAADNYIGATVQANAWHDDWVRFLVDCRLGPQLALAAANGHGGRLTERGARLLESAGVYYSSYRPRPSLLHGDLWSGNRAMRADGRPVVFDPAVYFGDREADLAMTRLFGGYGSRFYAAYQAAWPLDAAAGVRRDLHNLYHVLNHLNLFGGGYAAQALAMIDRLLAETGR